MIEFDSHSFDSIEITIKADETPTLLIEEVLRLRLSKKGVWRLLLMMLMLLLLLLQREGDGGVGEAFRAIGAVSGHVMQETDAGMRRAGRRRNAVMRMSAHRLPT